MSDYADMQPMDRSRAHTWHGCSMSLVDGISTGHHGSNTMKVDADGSDGSVSVLGQVVVQASKKPWSRRNAWGSLSYADLISRAIESTIDKRMTLAQIYEWMVQNVAYFRDKGSTNSSAGWKNSIRHNLSLHRRFKRVPNDDPGKSSWWMLNDAAQPGRSTNNNYGSVSSSSATATRKRTLSVVDRCDIKPPPPALRATTKPPAQSLRLLMDVHCQEPSSLTLPCGPMSPTWTMPSGQTCVFAASVPDAECSITDNNAGDSQVTQLTPLQWHQPTLMERLMQQLAPVQWPADSDTFAVAVGDTSSSFDGSYPPVATCGSSCTPLAPISELLSPKSQFLSSSPLLPSPPTYSSVQMLSCSSSGDQAQILKESPPPFSSANDGNVVSSSSFELMRPAVMPTSGEMAYVTVTTISGGSDTAGSQWSPGYSMLRQMLAQSHHQNALMHGVTGTIIGSMQPPTVAPYSTASQMFTESLQTAPCGSCDSQSGDDRCHVEAFALLGPNDMLEHDDGGGGIDGDCCEHGDNGELVADIREVKQESIFGDDTNDEDGLVANGDVVGYILNDTAASLGQPPKEDELDNNNKCDIMKAE